MQGSSHLAHLAAIGGGLLIILILGAWMASGAASGFVRQRIVSALKERFESDLEFKSLNVVVFPRVVVTGQEVVLHYKGRTDLPPLIAIHQFTAVANLLGLLRAHVSRVTLEGLRVTVPPREQGASGEKKPQGRQTANFVIDEIVADDTTGSPMKNWIFMEARGSKRSCRKPLPASNHSC